MATATRGTPSGTASVPGRNGNGMARWITAPETSEVRYTSGGRTRPGFATSRDALEPPPCSADGAVNLFHMKIGQEARSRSSGFLAVTFRNARFRAVSQFSASSCLSRAPRAKSLAISVITHSGTILRIAQVLLYMPTAVSVPRCQPSQRSCLRHHLLAFCIEVIHLAIPKGTH